MTLLSLWCSILFSTWILNTVNAKVPDSFKIADPNVECLLRLKAKHFQSNSKTSSEGPRSEGEDESFAERQIQLKQTNSFMIGKALQGSFEYNKKSYNGLVIGGEEFFVRGKKAYSVIASLSIQSLQEPFFNETVKGTLLLQKGEKESNLIRNTDTPLRSMETIGIVCRIR